MYICICNAINERKVNEAITAGAGSVARIYQHHGCAPKCGKCVPVMRERLHDSRTVSTADAELLPAFA